MNRMQYTIDSKAPMYLPVSLTGWSTNEDLRPKTPRCMSTCNSAALHRCLRSSPDFQEPQY